MLLPALDPADLLFYYSSPSALCSKYTGFHAHLGQASPALASEFSPCCPPARGALLQTRVWLALSGLPINTTFPQSRAFSATPFKMRPYPPPRLPVCLFCFTYSANRCRHLEYFLFHLLNLFSAFPASPPALGRPVPGSVLIHCCVLSSVQ